MSDLRLAARDLSDAAFLRPRSRPITTGPPPPTDPLPDDLAPESARRLRVACVICTALWTLFLAVNHLIAPHLHLLPGQVIPWPPIADALALGVVLLSLTVYRWAPRAARAGTLLVTVGIAYEIALAFAIGTINQWEPQAVAGRLSWVCVLILIFPSIVPGPPRRILFGSLIAASMDPVGLAIARARDWICRRFPCWSGPTCRTTSARRWRCCLAPS